MLEQGERPEAAPYVQARWELKPFSALHRLEPEGNEMKIVLDAIFNKATTTVDGGWRISFDCPNNEAQNISQISQLQGTKFHLVVLTEDALQNENDESEE